MKRGRDERMNGKIEKVMVGAEEQRGREIMEKRIRLFTRGRSEGTMDE